MLMERPHKRGSTRENEGERKAREEKKRGREKILNVEGRKFSPP